MAVTIKHAFVSSIPDDPAAVAAGEVVPSNWNAAHAISGGTPGSVLFIDGSNNLSQDNANFFWDDTNFVLKAGKRLQQAVNGTFVNALFPVYGGAIFANSWFVGQSGNTTLTGYNNTGVGFGPMIVASTGHDNTAVGTFALNVLTTSNFNTAVGVDALGELDFPGSTGGDFNSAFGVSSLHALEFGTGNTAIGNRAGNEIGRVIQSDNNTLVGMEVYKTSTNGSTNTVVGYRGGFNITSGSNNTLLGGWQGPSSALSSVIALSDGAGSLFLDYNFTNASTWTMAKGVPLAFQGGTSGTVKLTSNATTGSWAMTLPTTAGTNFFVLQTDGTGITSWVPQSGSGMAIGGAVTGGTSGSVLFIDGSGDLAQDNTNFFWDDTNFRLKVGSVGTPTGQYWVNGIRALYGVPNVAGNNWFEAGAGNTTVSGSLNFGTGDGCFASLTSGSNNSGVGAQAGHVLTTGGTNIAIGSQAMLFSVLDSNNIGIGALSLATLGNGSAGSGNNVGNVAIGFGAFTNALQGFNNICIGYQSFSGVIATANQNIVIGSGAGLNLGSAGATISTNTLIGTNCASHLNGSSNNNTWIGGHTGPTSNVSESIVLADGNPTTFQMLDYGLTSNAFAGSAFSAWSMSYNFHLLQPTVFNLYNLQDHIGAAMTVYERAAFDWFTTTNVFRISTQAGGGGTVRLIAIDGFQKAGAPAAGDLPSGTWTVINDTSGNQTWVVYNNSGTIRKVQLT